MQPSSAIEISGKVTHLIVDRRTFLSLAAAAGVLPALSPRKLFAEPAASSDLTALTIAEAAAMIQSGQTTSVKLTEALLARIAIYQPKLNAYITVMSRQALAQAAALDAEAKAGKFRSGLHGVPIALKDNIDTAGVRTTAASAVFDDRVPTEDAEVTRRLKEAGAVLIGKTNMHEFAYGGTSATTYFGPVRNPWALDHNPAGSSGGSGAAVSADLCFGALGTDTGGSIRMPAAFCSIVGLKPTVGLVSIRGIIPCVYSLDHCGPMTKTVEDAAILLNSLAGYDKNDNASVEHPKEDYVQAMKQPVAQLRVGIPRAPFFDHLDEATSEAIEVAIAVLSKLAVVVDDVTMPATSGFSWHAAGAEPEAYHRKYILQNAEAYSLQVRRFLQGSQALYDNSSDETCGEKLADYVEFQSDLQHVRKVIDDEFKSFDLLALPTMRIVPRTINEELSREEDPKPMEPERISNCTPFDIWGLPAVSIPCGLSKTGLPVGLMIAGPHFSEGRVLALAHAFEQATAWHTKRPALTPTTPVPPVKRL
jgi:aspartyl-tRNA(Asn)/glutamyl-tRNA(Gln) amidotransferase subunit A